MILTLADIARITGSRDSLPAAPVADWSIDTRTLVPGAVYFALRGENHDGHRFLRAAAEQGAVAAIVDDRDHPKPEEMRLIHVADPLLALQQLAAAARQHLPCPLIAITGSAGKTTTKETISTLAGAALRVTRSEGNLNNHIGLPLSLLRLDETAGVAVLEMGMNHAEEIRLLARIARPTIGVVTNVGTAHIENFSSVEGIALAKRELIEELGPAGIAVLNYDDLRVRAFAGVHAGRTVTYGMEPGADIRAENVQLTASGASFTIQGVPFDIQLPGRHGVWNVTAGVAVGSILQIPLEKLAEAARTLKSGRMRGERLSFNGITILNDCYNSNPEAAKAMIDTLAALPAARKIAVLGEMLELGAWSEQMHREVGAYAAAAGIQTVIGIRGAARHLADAAQAAGVESHFFEDPAEAGEALRGLAREGDAMLYKGSRGTRVEKALERFMAN
ncbi:MAG TPA: UDP-N-acetylmuramoyl-tripeptide--D-alanyl-D-alanine ligase [Bryobacteraceae bacterium]|nr:UDP-N-acetylmuramoyl-tripeptide--D-alanyl-D-alanine ligase [Bryobacteraceae bacterium]